MLILYSILYFRATQYYDDTFANAKEQKAFEKNLFAKTHRANGEIIMLDGITTVYRSSVDLFFYVLGNQNENGVCFYIFYFYRHQHISCH